MPLLYLLRDNHSQQRTMQGPSVLQKAVLIAQESGASSRPRLFGFAQG